MSYLTINEHFLDCSTIICLPASFRWRNTEQYVVVCICSASVWWFRQLQHCSTAYQMWGTAFPMMLTCTTSPHSALLISRLCMLPVCDLISLCLCLSLSLSLSLSFIGSPMSRALVGWRAGSWSSGGGIHVPVLRTSAGPCRAPALLPVPVLPVWMSSYNVA